MCAQGDGIGRSCRGRARQRGPPGRGVREPERGDSGDPCALNPPHGNDIDPVNPEMAVSAIRDIARLVPELAPLCAPTLAEEAQP